MRQQRGILTPEEQARVMQLQDLLIERCRAQRGGGGRARGTRQDSGGSNRQSSARKGRDREMGGCRLSLAARIREQAEAVLAYDRTSADRLPDGPARPIALPDVVYGDP